MLFDANIPQKPFVVWRQPFGGEQRESNAEPLPEQKEASAPSCP